MAKAATLLAGLVAAAALTLGAGTALARQNLALLVGASEYPALDRQYWLKGPANDVRLVRTYLTTAAPVHFAPEDVTVLADGVEGAAAPTLAAIRQAVQRIADRAGPGDFVYLHFSGHGSQAPALDPATETDGLDELFLPVDIGPWDDSAGHVDNALVDDEVGRMLDTIRAKGADVWVVFDSCHSGTVTRGAPAGDDEVRARQVGPEALGIPAARMAAAEEGAAGRGLPADPRAAPEAPVRPAAVAGGRLVAFFAAQTNETTPEKNLPRNAPGRIPQGVFTYTLFETLAEYPGITYRQLGQEVLRRYAVENLALTTPMFEGDLDAVVFDGPPAGRVAQWPAQPANGAFDVAAGNLQGLAEGSLMAVMATAADPTNRALGYVRVARADTFTATAEPVAAEGLPAPDPAALPRGTMLRKLGAELDFSLAVALPEGDSPAAAKMRDAAGRLDLDGTLGPRLRFVAPGAQADLRLAVLPDSPRPDAIWILPATGLIDAAAYDRTPSVGTADKTAEELAQTVGDDLARMAKALNLLRVGAGTGGAGGGLDVEVKLLTRTAEDPVLRPLDDSTVPRLVPGDQVHLEATNRMDIPVDLNVLYVGADWSISHMKAVRLQPGDTLRKGLFRITDKAFGRDRLVLVLSPAKPQTAVENLAFLAQPALELTRGGASRLAVTLAEAGFGATTRSAVSLEADDEGGPAPEILQFDLDTRPGG